MMQLLTNWEFWSAVVAALALGLSQIQPLYEIWNRHFSRASLTLEVYKYVGLGHLVGYPWIKFSMVLSNTGPKEVKIKQINITLSRDGNKPLTLPAQTYSPEMDQSKQLLFTGFKIKPDEDISCVLFFYEDWKRDQSSKYSAATNALRQDLEAKQDPRIPLGGQFPKIEGDPVNVRPFCDMLEENFIWDPGEYAMDVVIDAPEAKISVKKSYRFPLFESDSNRLRDFGKKYKYGDGLFWFSRDTDWSWIKINEA
jgi:hypothetical protein